MLFRLVRHQHWPMCYQVIPHPPYFNIGRSLVYVLKSNYTLQCYCDSHL